MFLTYETRINSNKQTSSRVSKSWIITNGVKFRKNVKDDAGFAGHLGCLRVQLTKRPADTLFTGTIVVTESICIDERLRRLGHDALEQRGEIYERILRAGSTKGLSGSVPEIQLLRRDARR